MEAEIELEKETLDNDSADSSLTDVQSKNSDLLNYSSKCFFLLILLDYINFVFLQV